MKKLYTFVIALMATSLAIGQSQRLCLLEEFTQASCGPCAAQNPALNALLSSNTLKVASIKYQTNWPGVDPMNTQTQTWVGPRVSYYGVTGVPNVRFDGNVTNGLPNVMNQSVIDNRYAVASPFEFDLVHSFSPNYDSIYINLLITCTQATSGTFKARIAMVEQEIDFCSPPGTNGEDVFYGVMRTMYPNATGFTLANSYALGDTFSISVAEAIPAYVYGFDQLAVVAFVQDDATKEVKQAAISEPLTLSNYAILKSCNPPALPPLICSNTVNGLSGELTNLGSATLTTCDINYSVDGGAPATFNWTGSLAPGATTNFTLPAVTISGNGGHSIDIWVATSNGTVNPQCSDTRTNLSIIANITGAVPPISELFSAVTFPPAGWGKYDANADNIGWTRGVQGVGGNNGSAKIDFYSSANGNIDDLYMPSIDLTGITAANLTFKIAKAPYSGYTDNLKVNASTDCGATWSTLWNKSDPALSTVAAMTSAYTPTISTVWRPETVDLANFLGQSNVNIVFKATSGYGNNGYLDEINVNLTTGVGENQLEEQISLFPTLSNGLVYVDLSAIKSNEVLISIFDISGKLVNTYTTSRSNRHEVNLGHLQSGTYMLRIDADGQRISKKVMLEK